MDDFESLPVHQSVFLQHRQEQKIPALSLWCSSARPVVGSSGGTRLAGICVQLQSGNTDAGQHKNSISRTCDVSCAALPLVALLVSGLSIPSDRCAPYTVQPASWRILQALAAAKRRLSTASEAQGTSTQIDTTGGSLREESVPLLTTRTAWPCGPSSSCIGKLVTPVRAGSPGCNFPCDSPVWKLEMFFLCISPESSNHADMAQGELVKIGEVKGVQAKRRSGTKLAWACCEKASAPVCIGGPGRPRKK